MQKLIGMISADGDHLTTKAAFTFDLNRGRRRKAPEAACSRGGKLRPRGHMWPNDLFNQARRAFTVISLSARLVRQRFRPL